VVEARSLLAQSAGWGEIGDGTLIVVGAEIEPALVGGRPAEALAGAERLAEILERRGTRDRPGPPDPRRSLRA